MYLLGTYTQNLNFCISDKIKNNIRKKHINITLTLSTLLFILFNIKIRMKIVVFIHIIKLQNKVTQHMILSNSLSMLLLLYQIA